MALKIAHRLIPRMLWNALINIKDASFSKKIWVCMSLKTAYSAILRVVCCDEVFSRKLSGLLFVKYA